MTPTPNDPLKRSRHVHYEANMFRLIAQIFGNGQDVVEARVSDPRRQAIWNAMVESFALHLRVLWDFFWPTESQVKRRDKGEINDVFAIDFFSSPEKWNVERPDTLDRDLRDRINWLVAHLTEERTSDPEKKKWEVVRIYNEVHLAILAFQTKADGNLLHEVWTKTPIPSGPVVVHDRPAIKGHGPVFFTTTDPGTGVTLPPEWFKGPSGG